MSEHLPQDRRQHLESAADAELLQPAAGAGGSMPFFFEAATGA